MNRRQKIVLSVTGIFLVALILMGLTYAYFLTQITGNTNPTSISVETANLALKYDDGNGFLQIANNLRPGDEIKFYRLDKDGNIILENGQPIVEEEKTFSVENTGNATVDSYAVILEELKITYANTVGTQTQGDLTNLKYPETLLYTLTCESNIEGNVCDGNETIQFPTTEDILIRNSIEENEIHTYKLKMYYENAAYDQSDDMNKKIEAKINIIDTKGTADIEGTVASAESGDYVQINSEPKKTYLDKDGRYKLVGVKPETHTLAVYNTSNPTTPKSSTIINLEKGETASVNNNTVTVDDFKRVVNIDINGNNYTINPEINGINTFKEGTLAYQILDNSYKNVNGTKYQDEPDTKVAAEISEETEKVLSKTYDDYGTSYYYRGNVIDNYVNYNGMCFRIVRIEGDGSTKLILEDKDAECNSDAYTGTWAVEQSRYGVDLVIGPNDTNIHPANYLNPSYYASTSQVNIINTWFTESAFDESELKEDTWCLGNITDVYTTAYPYSKLSNETDTRDTLIESGTPFYYESFTRFGDEGVEGEQYATFKCEKNNYTSFKSYAAPLTTDELIYAGAKHGTENANFYLLNNYQKNDKTISWWSLTLGKFNGTNDRALVLTAAGKIGNSIASGKNFSNGGITYARPAITLKKDIMVSSESGNGSKTSPYVID